MSITRKKAIEIFESFNFAKIATNDWKYKDYSMTTGLHGIQFRAPLRAALFLYYEFTTETSLIFWLTNLLRKEK